MTGQELSNALMMGNDVALQWYYATHPQNRPVQTGEISIQPTGGGGTSIAFGSGSLVLIALAIGAAIFLLKD